YGISFVHKSIRKEFLYCASQSAKNIAFEGISSELSPSVDDQSIRSGTLCSSNMTLSVISACFIFEFYLSPLPYTFYTTRINTINIPTTSINSIYVNQSFFKSLKIIRKPKSTCDKLTHNAINQIGRAHV